MKDWKERIAAGVFTIEAAFVITTCCVLIMLVLMMAFYQHDRAVLCKMGMTYTAGLLHMAEEPVTFDGVLEAERLEEQGIFRLDGYSGAVSPEEVEARFRESAETRLLMTDLRSVEVSADDSTVRISYEASFRPGLAERILDLFGSGRSMSGSFQLQRGLDPEEFVRICRSVFGSK